MKEKLKKCKNLNELYEVLGEKYCAKIAFVFLMAWAVMPIVMSIFNLYCHSIYPNLWELVLAIYYSVYGIIATIVGVLGTAFLVCYVYGKKQTLGITIKGYLKDKFQNEIWILLLLGMLIWGLFSTLLSGSIPMAFWGSEIRHDGYLMYCIYAGVFGCAYMVMKSEYKNKFLYYLVVVADVLALVMWWSAYDVPFLGLAAVGYDTSVFGNSNHYGYFLSIVVACLTGMYYTNLNEKSRDRRYFVRLAFLIISLGIQIFVLIQNNTLGSYLAVSITMVLAIVLYKAKGDKLDWSFFAPIAILVLFTYLNAKGIIPTILRGEVWISLKELVQDLLNVSSGAQNVERGGTGRIGLWLESFRIIAKHPLFGIGPEMLQEKLFEFGPTDRPHNEYIQHALFMGIPAAVMYIAALITLCINRVKNVKKLSHVELAVALGVISYSISGFFGNTMFYTTPYFFILLGFISNPEGLARDLAPVNIAENEIVKAVSDKAEDKKIKTREKLEWKKLIKGDEKATSSFASYVLSAWGILPAIVSIGFIPICIKYSSQGELILTYEQIMYNFLLACIIGITGFVLFMFALSKRRDNCGMNSLQIYKAKCKNEIWIVLLVVLLGWSFISAVLCEDKLTAFIGTAVKRDGFFAYCMYASVMGLAYFISEEEHKKRVFNIFVMVANYMVLVMMFFEWRVPYLNMMSHGYSCATFMNQNHFGYYLCMSIMCLVGLFYSDLLRRKESGEKLLSRKGIVYLLSFIWQMYGLMINNTLGAYVAIVLAMLIILIFWRVNKGRLHPLAFAPIVITIVITYLSYMNVITNIWGETIGNCIGQFWRDLFTVVEHAEGFEQAGTNRMMLWLATLEIIPQKPIFGFGPEGLTGMFREAHVFDRPHNEYLQMAVFCGIPALVLYLSALISLCVNRCKNLKKLSIWTLTAAGVVVGYLISAFFGFTLYYTTPYFYMFLGFVAGSVRESNLDATKAKKRKEENDEKE